MAILVVRVIDQGSNPLRTQPGDVVEVVEDGHTFSASEQALYRFITVPGSEAEYAYLKTPKYEGEDLVAKRAVRLDLTSFERSTATKAELDTLVRTR